MKIDSADNSYRTFCDLSSGYRMFCVVAEALRCGVIDLLEEEGRSVEALLVASALRPAEGRRFLELLVSVGLLEQQDGCLCLSRFSRTFLSRTSPVSQRHVIEFEPVLMENWRQLGAVLHEGQGALIREQPDDNLRERRQLFQLAMAEAAQVRSRELWAALAMLPEEGLIIDIGAGDGTYLRTFLARHLRWRGVACDLPEVCAEAASGVMPNNLDFYPCNILDEFELAGLVARHRGAADLLLFSNICHCHSPAENSALLAQAGAMLAADGRVVIHDFCRDANSFGAMYDLHMLVNTYNGRSYSIAETAELLRSAGFERHEVAELPSGSLAIVASRVAASQAVLS
jgi:SAM-dependent methyltransferase